jgi:DNA-binding LacI/PurR family transcriptional regulator
VPGDYTEPSGGYAARGMLYGELPTAVFAGSDRGATASATTFLRAGLQIPDDVSIVGYEDSRMGRMSFIDLATVRQDEGRMGELSAQASAERLDGTRVAEQHAVAHLR